MIPISYITSTLLRKGPRASHPLSLVLTIKSPEEAADIFIKSNPALSRETQRREWDIVLDTRLTDYQKENGLLRMSREKWTLTRDVLAKALDARKEVPVEDLYTNDFLPKVLPPERGPRAFPPVF